MMSMKFVKKQEENEVKGVDVVQTKDVEAVVPSVSIRDRPCLITVVVVVDHCTISVGV